MNTINDISITNIISIIALIFSIFSLYYQNKNKKEIEILKNNLSKNQHKFIKNYTEQRKIIKEIDNLFLNIDENFITIIVILRMKNTIRQSYPKTKFDYEKLINIEKNKYIKKRDELLNILKESRLIIKRSIYIKSKDLINEYDFVIEAIENKPEEILHNLTEYKKEINKYKKELENECRDILGSEL